MQKNETQNLKLPLLRQGQLNKEITVNQAFLLIDGILNTSLQTLVPFKTPPGNLPEGTLILTSKTAKESFAPFPSHIAFFKNGWQFIKPQEGLILWAGEEKKVVVFTEGEFKPIHGSSDNSGQNILHENKIKELEERIAKLEKKLKEGAKGEVLLHNGSEFAPSKTLPKLGVEMEADDFKKLAVRSDYNLFTSNTGDVRFALNKLQSTATASFLFQTEWRGMAEFGLIGGNNFILKVSYDGNTWFEVFEVDMKTGKLNFKQDVLKNGNKVL